MIQGLIFIGNYTDDVTYKLITENDIRDLSQAARMFQKRLIANLANQEINFKAISVLPSDGKIILPKNMHIENTMVEAIPINYRSFSSNIAAIKRICKAVDNCGGNKTTILMYAVNPVVMIPLLRYKKKYKLTLVTICPELPQYRRYRKSISNSLKRIVFQYFNRRFDSYIVFAEAMKEHLPKNRRYMLLEGFAPEYIQEPHIREKNIAMYAGGLAEDNGIKMMIEAAHKARLLDELWICGVGDCLEYVMSNTDEKIKYLGRLTNDKVLAYEGDAKVLLNVRNPKNELTKFSFPSKILEYMVSGGIVISSELPGIPHEYYEYIEFLNEYTSDELALAMDRVFSMSDDSYLTTVTKNMDFVMKKMPQNRVKEIMSFIM